MEETLPKKILIVEDEEPIARALEMKLAKEGFDVSWSPNGKDALSFMESTTPDFILLDLVMPEMDGFSFIENIKKDHPDIPVLVLTNLGQEEDKERVMSLGAVGYLVKSNTPIGDIVDHIMTYCKGESAPPEESSSPEEQSPQEQPAYEEQPSSEEQSSDEQPRE